MSTYRIGKMAMALVIGGLILGVAGPGRSQSGVSVQLFQFRPGQLEVKAGNGTATLKTASGGMLWAMMNGDRNIVIRDEKGAVASISTYDVYQSNGVIHVIDRVVLPN